MKWIVGLCALLLGFLPLRILALGSPSSVPAWANPSQMALKNVVPSHIPDRYHTSLVENLECQDKTPPSASPGCYIQTAYGEQDVESNQAIFAGTGDKALPITPVVGGQVLIGWPGADSVLTLTSIPTGGFQAGLYRFFTSALADQTNALGQITGKRITRTPDVTLTDSVGQPLLFNPNTIAFSDHGSWLVGETLNAGFVRVNLATLRVVSFAPAFLSNAPGLNESQLAITDDGQFVAVANRTATAFRVYDLSNCGGSTCASFNYWPFLAGQLSVSFVPVHLRFLNNGLLSFHGNSGLLEATYLLAPTDHIDSLLSYLGLGDSFAAGEGAYSYRSGTDTSSNLCHLSGVSYPFLTTQALFTTSAGNSVACSGAKIGDITPSNPQSYAGQASNGIALSSRSPDSTYDLLTVFAPGYLPQAAFAKLYQPSILTVQVGGNDIGFREVLIQCVMLHISGGNTCYNSYEDRLELANLIDQTLPKLVRLYKELKAMSPLGKLYIVGYPEIVVSGDCANNVHLDVSETRLAGYLTKHLNAAIAKASQQAGVTYIDVSQAFAGHRLCENDSSVVAVNGLTAGDNIGIQLPAVLGKGNIKFIADESYHPSAYGQQLLDQVIRSSLRTVSSTVAPVYSPAASDATGLLAAAKTNRPLTTLSFAHFTSPSVVGSGQLSIAFEGLDAGLRPNTDYTVHVDGAGGPVLGTVHADASGSVTGRVTAPAASSDVVVHTIDIVGPNLAGGLSDVRQLISISSPESAITPTTAVPVDDPPNHPTQLQQTTLVASVITTAGSASSKEMLGASTSNPQLGSGAPQQLRAVSGHSAKTHVRWPQLPTISWLMYVYALLILWIIYVAGRLSVSRQQFAQ